MITTGRALTTTDSTRWSSTVDIRGALARRATVLAALPLAVAAFTGLTAAPAQAAGCDTSRGAVLYEHTNYQGACYYLSERSFDDLGAFNDKASSVHVAAGCRIEVYRDKYRLGLTQWWGHVASGSDGDNDLTSSLIGNDKISSVDVSC